MSDKETTLGSRVAGRRRMLNRSQAWLAKELGVSTRYVSKIENDGATPSWELATRLAPTLGVSLDFIAYG